MKTFGRGISMPVEDITEALWGTKVSAGTVSQLNKKVYDHIEAWRNWPLKGSYTFAIFLCCCTSYDNPRQKSGCVRARCSKACRHTAPIFCYSRIR